MKNTTHIVLIASSATQITDVRNICNEIEGIEINVPNRTIRIGEFVHTHILDEYPKLAYDDVQVYGLSDFMELNNNGDYHDGDWFMSYVHVNS